MASHSSATGAGVVLVLFILLVIILIAASGRSRYGSCGSWVLGQPLSSQQNLFNDSRLMSPFTQPGLNI
ncbi:hypothetical protein VQL36_02870 [Chengkuizengella sp. SCS-71B]|uniref:hypothetical protein n=1 Tax=Chengkuizengella sp. SCS-71B TaxID=3115290 RepID=UPI0032C22333